MRHYEFAEFGLEHLVCKTGDPRAPGDGEVRVAIKALSLNYRDLLILRGQYFPSLAGPTVPLSDGAGVIDAVGPGVQEWQVGDRVVSHFVAGWQDGPYSGDHAGTTLGLPGPGLAAEFVTLPAHALVAAPDRLDFAQAATLTIAGLTAWSAVVTEGAVSEGHTVLTLGTGGVSIFALQLSKALGAKVIITSSSDDKLARATQLGADAGVNYTQHPNWEKEVASLTSRRGADLVVENGGVATLSRSLRAVRPGGTIAMLGALSGLTGEVDIAPILMKRVRVAGILVDSRAAFRDLIRFVEEHQIDPVIDRRFSFDELPDALRYLESAQHFGKVVVELG